MLWVSPGIKLTSEEGTFAWKNMEGQICPETLEAGEYFEQNGDLEHRFSSNTVRYTCPKQRNGAEEGICDKLERQNVYLPVPASITAQDRGGWRGISRDGLKRQPVDLSGNN